MRSIVRSLVVGLICAGIGYYYGSVGAQTYFVYVPELPLRYAINFGIIGFAAALVFALVVRKK